MSPIPVTVTLAEPQDAAALSDVAAITFPLACPPGMPPEDSAAFIAKTLSKERFEEYLADPGRTVLKAVAEGEIVGYAMLVAGEPADPDVAAVVTLRPVTELSKMYVLPGHHGSGVAGPLMQAAVETARRAGQAGVWLGVNQENARAQRYYGKHGFGVVGTKSFTVGSRLCADYVMLLEF